MKRQININTDNIRRKRSTEEDEEKVIPLPVTAGAIDKIVDLAFNPSREKIREVTSVNAMQAKLLPQLDIIDAMWQYVIEVAAFRQDAELYNKTYKRKAPIPPSLIDDFIYRTAQWQKSVQGMNLKSAIDLALAETETRASEEGDMLGGFDE